MNLPVVVKTDVGMWKARVAVASIAFGSGMVAMALMGWHYDGRLEAMHKAHRQEIASMKRLHTIEKKQVRAEVTDELKALRQDISRVQSCRSDK